MIINGEKLEFKELSLKEYLAQKGFKSKFIAVELNGEIVPKANFESLILKQNDKVEIVNFVGGG